jgi:ketosteroid isomerase-like protein
MDTTTMTTHVTRTPVETVSAVYAAFGQGDLPGLFALLHPDVDWSVTVTAPGGELVPMLRNGVGLEAVQRYFEGVAQLEMHVFDVGRVLTEGDVVIVEVHLEATHRDTGKRAALDELHHWVVRDGQVVRYRPFVDTAALIDLFRS